MQPKTIAKEDLTSFVGNLSGLGEVVGVKRKNGKYVYDQISDPSELCLDYDVTILPPKKYFLPQKETFLKFKIGDQVSVEPVIEAGPRFIIGVHPYDIKAIELLDEVYTAKNPDPNYLKKRENSIIIGVDCQNPSPNAFCSSILTNVVDTGFDLLLTDIGDRYVVTVGSEKGDELLTKNARTREATDQDIALMNEAREKSAQKYQLSLGFPPFEIPGLLESNYENPLWAELAEKCLSCGRCTLVCPTCVCFDVQDEMELNLTDGIRYRTWDSCLLPDFAVVATGENFRPDKVSRIRHRYFRKGLYMAQRYGKLGCVGCGRCISECLADISSPVDTYKRLRGGQAA